MGQKFGVLLYSSHMSSEDFFLLFQNVANFLLKCKEFLILFISHSFFHCIKIILYFSFILNFCFLLFFNLDLFVDNILIMWIIFFVHRWAIIWWNVIFWTIRWKIWLFIRIWSIFFFWVLLFYIYVVLVYAVIIIS